MRLTDADRSILVRAKELLAEHVPGSIGADIVRGVLDRADQGQRDVLIQFLFDMRPGIHTNAIETRVAPDAHKGHRVSLPLPYFDALLDEISRLKAEIASFDAER